MPLKEFLDPELNTICDFQQLKLNYTGSNIDFAEIKNRLKAVVSTPLHFLLVVTPLQIATATKYEERKNNF